MSDCGDIFRIFPLYICVMLLYCVLTYTTVREKKRYGARLVMRLAYIFPFEGEKEKGR